jgi:hypothetical protein
MHVNTFEIYDLQERLEHTKANTNTNTNTDSKMSDALLNKYEIVKKYYLKIWLSEAEVLSKCTDSKEASEHNRYASRFTFTFLF